MILFAKFTVRPGTRWFSDIGGFLGMDGRKIVFGYARVSRKEQNLFFKEKSRCD